MPWAFLGQPAMGAGGGQSGVFCGGAGPANMWLAVPALHPVPTSALHYSTSTQVPSLGKLWASLGPWPGPGLVWHPVPLV